MKWPTGAGCAQLGILRAIIYSKGLFRRLLKPTVRIPIISNREERWKLLLKPPVAPACKGFFASLRMTE
jgi:hypothetical protein